MENYTKKILLRFGIKDGDIEDIRTQIDSIAKAKDLKFDVSKDAYRNVDKLVKDFNRKMRLDIIDPKKWASAFKEAGKGKIQESMENIFAGGKELNKENITAHAVNKLSGIVKSGLDSLIDLVKDAWKELQSLVGYSKLSTQSVREQMFTYGFTFAENYAYDKTMDLLGLQDIEDVWYMNNQEQQKFREKFEEYSNRYTQLYDQGFFEEMQEYNWEMEEFKEDFKYSVIQWIVDNKEVIKSGMNAIMTLAKWFLKFFSWITGTSTKEEKEDDKTKTNIEKSRKKLIEDMSIKEIAEKTAINYETVKSAETSNYSNSYNYGTYDNRNIKVDVGGVTNNYDNNNGYLSNPAEMTYQQILHVLVPGRYAY